MTVAEPDNDFGDEGVRLLAGCLALTRLTRLDIDCTFIYELVEWSRALQRAAQQRLYADVALQRRHEQVWLTLWLTD